MPKKNDELLKRLLATFRIEADEHIKAMAAALLALEKSPSDTNAASIVESVFREAHSLKGAARAVSLTTIESLCQSLESVFSAMKSHRIAVTTPLLDLLHQAIGQLDALLASDASSSAPVSVTHLTMQLDRASEGTITNADDAAPLAETTPPPLAPPPLAGTAPSPGTVRMSTSRLDAVMRQAEELLSPRLAARQRTLELREAASAIASWKKSRVGVQPALRRMERTLERTAASTTAGKRSELATVLGYLDQENVFITTLEERLSRLSKAAARDYRTLSTMADALLDDIKEMQLLPFSSLFEAFPRVARELAREQGKVVALITQGAEIEVDRRILEELKDPLLHLLRNAIDHGIEMPATRTAAGKPTHGTLTLSASLKEGGKVEIRLADDGAGIDADAVLKAAKKLDLPAIDAADTDAMTLIFQSGVSTSPIITDVSGRGLGLAIVHEKVERLGGQLSVESHAGHGTRFHLVLPASLATLHGVLVRANGSLYVVPLAGVARAARVAADTVRTVENRETIVLDEQVIPLVSLTDVLETPGTTDPAAAAYLPVLILGPQAARIAFRVDDILGEHEILVKPLGMQLARVRNVTGATTLGTGQMVPVLNVADLLKSAASHTATARAVAASMVEPQTKQSILIAEDSITSRSLLKNILESAGYTVTTTVDGMDAYTTLKTQTFDLVVSDVEMPRMDGFDLTARIRADKQLSELPVILVTALESREHRERGIDAGANAYIVKSSFDQSNLLETIRRLI